MKKRYFILTMILALILTALPVSASAAASNGKLQNRETAGLPAASGQKTYNYDAYRYGAYIYYSYHSPYEGDNCTNYLYRMKTNGSKKTLLGKVKKGQSGWISAVYGNNLLYATSDTGSGAHITSLNLKTKKTKYIKKFSAHFDADYTIKKDAIEPYHYKNYFAASTATGALMERPIWIFNAKTNTPKLISKKGWSIAVKGKTVYYLESSGKKILLKSCSIKGTGKKTLNKVKAANDPSAYISSASGKYCIYYVDGTEYKYQY